MKKIDWARKLTSRKFWAAVAAFVTSVMAAFGAGDDIVVTVTGVISATAVMIAYIIGEGLTDAANSGSAADQTEDPSEGDGCNGSSDT